LTGKHRPVFQGQRFSLFDWQLDRLNQMLGRQSESFDVLGFLFDLDAALASSGHIVPPQKQQHEWLEQLVFAEARRRALPIANVPKLGKLSTRMADALTSIMGKK